MLVRRISRWFLVIALFSLSVAAGQTGNPVPEARGGGKLRGACGYDLRRFCVDVRPGSGRLVQCLSSHATELSAACGTMIAAAAGGGELRAACGQDLQRFCIGVQPGAGRLIECLSSHAHEMSPACATMVAAMHARRDAPNRSEQAPATQPAAPPPVSSPPAVMGSILRTSCGPDAQRLCAGVRREGDVLNCLESQRMQLSTTCNMYFQKLSARPAVQRNVPSKRPPSPPPASSPGNSNATEPGPG